MIFYALRLGLKQAIIESEFLVIIVVLPQRLGLLFIFSSPSGAGKTALTRLLCAKDERLHLSVSSTTRSPRAKEIHGQDYFFLSPPEFQEKIHQNCFLEHAQVFDHLYGTQQEHIDQALNRGQDIVLDMDWQGARKVKEAYGQRAISMFILPPNIAALKERLQQRGQDAEEVIQRRMDAAQDELQHWVEYDYLIVNQHLDCALADALSVIQSARLKRAHYSYLMIS